MSISISLIIPVFNTLPYLNQCIDSALNQSLPFHEIIIIDDGSTDGSAELLLEYEKRYRIIQVYFEKHGKQGRARNVGLKKATGTYVMFLDSDDMLAQNAVEVLTAELRKISEAYGTECDGVYYEGISFGKIEDYFFDYTRDDYTLFNMLWEGREFFSASYMRNYKSSSCMTIYRRAFLDKIHLLFPEGMYFEDNFFSFIFIIEAKSVYCIHEQLYYRRVRDNSTITSEMSFEKIRDVFGVATLIYQYIQCHMVDFCGIEYSLLKFCSNIMIQALFMSAEYKNEKELLMNNKILIALQNLKYYIKISDRVLPDKNQWDIENLLLYLRVYLLAKKNDIPFFQIEKYHEEIKLALRVATDRYRDILSKIPLYDKNTTIGIYGKGRHTEGLIYIYKKIIGDINCKLIIYETKKNADIFCGYEVNNIQDIDTDIDYLIISSSLYQNEMQKEIDGKFPKSKIITFYGENIKDDIFSDFRELFS